MTRSKPKSSTVFNLSCLECKILTILLFCTGNVQANADPYSLVIHMNNPTVVNKIYKNGELLSGASSRLNTSDKPTRAYVYKTKEKGKTCNSSNREYLNRDWTHLVLSGGVFKGFAHLGALHQLEKNEIGIDSITGTSIGAMIGALYGIGMTAEEIMKMTLPEGEYKKLKEKMEPSVDRINQLSYDFTLITNLTRKFPIALQKNESQNDFNLSTLLTDDPEVWFLDGSLSNKYWVPGNMDSRPRNYSEGLRAGQQIHDVLQRELFAAQLITAGCALDMYIPVIPLVTTIDSADTVALKSGDFSRNVRASMSFPFMFTPEYLQSVNDEPERGYSKYRDGGLLANYGLSDKYGIFDRNGKPPGYRVIGIDVTEKEDDTGSKKNPPIDGICDKDDQKSSPIVHGILNEVSANVADFSGSVSSSIYQENREQKKLARKKNKVNGNSNSPVHEIEVLFEEPSGFLSLDNVTCYIFKGVSTARQCIESEKDKPADIESATDCSSIKTANRTEPAPQLPKNKVMDDTIKKGFSSLSNNLTRVIRRASDNYHDSMESVYLLFDIDSSDLTISHNVTDTDPYISEIQKFLLDVTSANKSIVNGYYKYELNSEFFSTLKAEYVIEEKIISIKLKGWKHTYDSVDYHILKKGKRQPTTYHTDLPDPSTMGVNSDVRTRTLWKDLTGAPNPMYGSDIFSYKAKELYHSGRFERVVTDFAGVNSNPMDKPSALSMGLFPTVAWDKWVYSVNIKGDSLGGERFFMSLNKEFESGSLQGAIGCWISHCVEGKDGNNRDKFGLLSWSRDSFDVTAYTTGEPIEKNRFNGVLKMGVEAEWNNLFRLRLLKRKRFSGSSNIGVSETSGFTKYRADLGFRSNLKILTESLSKKRNNFFSDNGFGFFGINYRNVGNKNDYFQLDYKINSIPSESGLLWGGSLGRKTLSQSSSKAVDLYQISYIPSLYPGILTDYDDVEAFSGQFKSGVANYISAKIGYKYSYIEGLTALNSKWNTSVSISMDWLKGGDSFNKLTYKKSDSENLGVELRFDFSPQLLMSSKVLSLGGFFRAGVTPELWRISSNNETTALFASVSF